MTDETRIDEEEEPTGESELSERSDEQDDSDDLDDWDDLDEDELEELDDLDELDEEAERAVAAAELRLVRSGQETGDTFPIHGRAVIGRFDPTVGPIDIDLSALPEAIYISRKHAALEFADGAWVLTDLGSSNGTFVLVPGEDFRRISEPTPLADGAQIALGNARFVFRIGSDDS